MDSPNPQDLYQDLLNRYRKGECTPAEQALLDQWYASLETGATLPETEAEKQPLLARNWQALTQRTIHETTPEPVVTPWRRTWYWAAASVVLVGLGLYLFRQPASPLTGQSGQTQTADVARVDHTNTSAQPEQVRLADNSVVTLQPGSKISYPAAFAADRREVSLVGEAFFDVQKNPKRPFLVYSRDLVTRVLGTSFRVSAYPDKRDVTVAVRTGRVSVYAPQLAVGSKTKPGPTISSVILTPNQQVTYRDAEQRLVKTLVAQPVPLTPVGGTSAFSFQNAPVSSIIAAIEKAYGVDIVYNEETMSRCFITTTLDQETLHDKLRIICRLTGATYKVIDAQIIVTGPGC